MLKMILLGNLFEIVFISYMILKIKGLKNKKILYTFCVLLSYLISGVVVNFTYNNQYLCYIVLSILNYTFLKIIYKDKSQIPDLFLAYYVEMIICYTSLITIKMFGYNDLAMYINRLILILIMIGYKPLKKLYLICIKNWNRKQGNKVKAITVRNVSIITMNISFYIINWYVVNYLQTLIK